MKWRELIMELVSIPDALDKILGGSEGTRFG